MSTIKSKGIRFGGTYLQDSNGLPETLFIGPEMSELFASAQVTIGDYSGTASVYFHASGRQSPKRWVVIGLTAPDSVDDYRDTYPSMNVIRRRIGERNLSARQRGRPTETYTLPRTWSGFTRNAYGERIGPRIS